MERQLIKRWLDMNEYPPKDCHAYYWVGEVLVDGKTEMEAWFFCPISRQWASITNHSIGSDGEVNASVACAGIKKVDEKRGPCDYHEWVRFAGWPTEYYKAAGEEYLKTI